jgi:AraC-like DNA-binding protein
MSERTLTRLVLRETGMSFGRWRQQLHIIIALQRLSGGALVQRVAEDLGYESVSAFITMFKKALGKPPARYFADKDDGKGA